MVVAVAPFEINAEGIALIAGTRVTLDSVIMTFHDGATPEEIAEKYPSLDLADIYSTIGYYLRNRSEVDQYLHRSSLQAKKVRKSNELRFPPGGVRSRLLARRSKKS